MILFRGRGGASRCSLKTRTVLLLRTFFLNKNLVVNFVARP